MPRVDPRVLLASLTPPIRQVVDAFLARTRAAGVPVYAVGGPVRDLLLKREIRDLDLLVEAEHADGTERILRDLPVEGCQFTRHARFRTFVVQHRGETLDIAVARAETYAHPGALPQVTPGSLREDLARRDFRVNALAVPLAPPEGVERVSVEAVPGALSDLREGHLEILHDRSFHDDPTRALRAARLAPRLGFKLTASARTGLTAAVRDGAFGGVSGERFRREFEKAFSDAPLGLDPAAALRLLSEWHVLAALEPGLALPRAVVAPIRRLGRSLAQPPWELRRHRPWVPGLSLWLAELPPALRRRVIARLKVTGATATSILGFPKTRDHFLRRLPRLRGRGAVDRAVRDLSEEQLLALHAASQPAGRRRLHRWAQEDRQRRSPITGTDLQKLGLEGVAIGRVLLAVREAYLDRRVETREDALTLARELARRTRP